MSSQETQFSAESCNMECNEDPLMSVGCYSERGCSKQAKIYEED